MLREYRGVCSVVRTFKEVNDKFYSDLQVKGSSGLADKSKSQMTHTAC